MAKKKHKERVKTERDNTVTSFKNGKKYMFSYARFRKDTYSNKKEASWSQHLKGIPFTVSGITEGFNDTSFEVESDGIMWQVHCNWCIELK